MAGKLPHRCLKCRKRYTFNQHWEDYTKHPRKCTCGSKKFFVDKWMLRRGKEQKCNCTGYHFPHRTGSMHCTANPLSAWHSARERFGVVGEELAEIYLSCIWEAEGGRCGEEAPF